MSEEDKPIRVVDRRMFTSDGELRPGIETEDTPEPAKAAAAPPPPPAGGPAPAAGASERSAESSPAFLSLISFLASNVYAALGVDPMTGKALGRRDPAAAKQMIDWLAVLEQKCRGALSFEETDLLSRALYELRMAYVEAVHPPGPEPPRQGR